MILVDKEIKQRGKDIVIEGYDENNVNSVSYDVTLECIITNDAEKESYILQPGETIFVRTKEMIHMPDDLMGRIGEKNSKMRLGIQVSGPHYFPGHKTYMFLRVSNISPNRIKLDKGDKIAQIFFEQLKEAYEEFRNYLDILKTRRRIYIMKKKLVSALALMMSCVMLAACGGNKVEENTTTPQTETSEAVTESTEEAASTETEAAGELTDVNVAALKGPTAMGMVKLMDDSDNGDTGANHYNFTIAASPDEITPQIVQGNVDIAAVPANLASVLYNKEGVDVSVLAVNTLGVLYIVENGDSVQSVADLKGKTIYASGKGATPEYALNYMLTANGIDPEKDVTIEYKSEHSECVAALAANEDAVAMLPQPFVTVAMTQNENIRVALDLTEEWEKASGDGDTKAALITGVVIARNDFIEAHPDAVETFLQQYEASVNYVNDNVADAAVLVGNYDIVAAQVAEKAIPECNIAFIAGNDMKAKLSSYLGILFEQNPAAVGGALPNDDFYYNAD